MKKLLTVLLSLAIIMSSFGALSVSAAVLSLEDIVITENASNTARFTVTVASSVGGTMTAIILDESGSDYYGADAKTVTTANASGKYIYTFNFKMQADVVAGTYKVRLGNNVESIEKEFEYKFNDKVRFYNTLSTKTADEIADFIDANKSSINIDFAGYEELVSASASDANALKVLNLINAEIANGWKDGDTVKSWDTCITLVPGYHPTEEEQNIVFATDAAFKAEFEESINIGKMAIVTEEDWSAYIEEMFNPDGDDETDDAIYDPYYYQEATADSALLSVVDAYDLYKQNACNVDVLDADEYVKAFDKATLMLSVDKKNAGTMKLVFLYYVDKGVISPDMSNIQKLIDAEKDSEFWIALQTKNKTTANTDCAVFAVYAEEIAHEMINDGVLNEQGSQQTPTTPSIDRPTAPSTGGGGGGGSASSSQTTQPKPEAKPEQTATFSDIAAADWAKDAIETLAEKGVLAGRGDGKFAPNDSVTREEFVKIIVSAFGLKKDGANSNFSDISKDRWSYEYIAVANELGIVTGSGDTFNPTSNTQRQDMAVIIYRVFELLGAKVDGDAKNFSDNTEISDYAKEAVAKLSGAGIINGMGDDSFAPKAEVTRAQAAKVVYGLLVLLNK